MGLRAVRLGYLVFGLVSVGLGLVGSVVPVMPSTVFFIVALWAFKRSSPPLEAWLLARSPALRDWERERAITRRTKIVAISMIWLSIGLSIAVTVRRRQGEWRAVLSGVEPYLNHPVLLVPPLLLVTAVGLTIFLSTRKTKRVGVEPT